LRRSIQKESRAISATAEVVVSLDREPDDADADHRGDDSGQVDRDDAEGGAASR